MRIIGLLHLVLGSLAALGELKQLSLPTARWFFETSRDMPWLNTKLQDGSIFPWFGWLSVAFLIITGIFFICKSFYAGPANPMTQRRINRFCQIKRGYYSLWILGVLAMLASFDQALVGKRALAVKYNDHWVFPAFLNHELKNKDFGLTGPDAEAPANYRKLKKIWSTTQEGQIYLPFIPYDPTGDTLPALARPLNLRDGKYYVAGSFEPYYGLAAQFHPDSDDLRLRFTMRDGKRTGAADGWDEKRNPIYSAQYQNGLAVTEKYTGEESAREFVHSSTNDLNALFYHPAPPMLMEKHWLGTNSQGYDVIAYLFGGFQSNFKAIIIYLPFVYTIGITIGMLMGFFGGWFDLIVQRMIEILSNMPYLFIVIIFSSMVSERLKGLPVILTILILFGWMGMTYLMRTAAYRDKNKDYISAARVLGASTPRILFRHLLPNTVSILITIIPFTVAGLISALSALDYLGFGLPPESATWGRLLNDGLSNLSAPWLVSAVFFVLTATLVLITFIGEAVREAFDPKKFTYYR